MAKNSNLGAAKAAKNDEFYTQYADIQKEVNAYLEYNPDTFRDKTVLLPCDDPEWSNFTRFFAQNFERLGLKRLISTSYAVESKKYKDYEPTLFETESPYLTSTKLALKARSSNSPETPTAAAASTSTTWNGTTWKATATSAAPKSAP